MPKANEVATELRKLADALDKSPDAEIVRPSMNFSHTYVGKAKEKFLALAHLLPLPLKKGNGYSENVLELTYESATIIIASYIDKQLTCELVEPAKPAVYRCDPILSEAEESSLEVAS
jgi:hypothetical protein